MKIKWFVLFILVLFVVQPFSVSAHTSLKNSNPAEGEVIKGDLTKVRLNFDTAIEKISTVELKTAQGDVISLEKPLIIGNEWSAAVQQKLESGTYLIRWKLISEDGHPVEGTIRFDVKAAVASSDATDEQVEAKKPEPQQSNQASFQLNQQKPSNRDCSRRSYLGSWLFWFWQSSSRSSCSVVKNDHEWHHQ
ncbi:copper resistance protein CopC [Exiguobacterium sp. K1]|uniref:copper resistance CopC family protein n=1 Tax=Exiguobacterium sp. K1 TaxID=2980105 RepID=UPI00299D5982|nr:copper resistance protein CopC [Exiguobacterium sp. K1]MDX1260685.1 copper resistance protein CopC [Exiguobacterium sp. K1]